MESTLYLMAQSVPGPRSPLESILRRIRNVESAILPKQTRRLDLSIGPPETVKEEVILAFVSSILPHGKHQVESQAFGLNTLKASPCVC